MVESQTQITLGRRIGQRDVLVHIQHIQQESGRDTRTEQHVYAHRQQQPGLLRLQGEQSIYTGGRQQGTGDDK